MRWNPRAKMVVLVAMGICLTAGTAKAVVSATPDPFPPGSGFVTPDSCINAFGFCAKDLRSSNFTLTAPPTFNGSGDEEMFFDATYTGTFTDLLGGFLGSFSVTGTDHFVLFGRGSDTATGLFNAQLVDESLTVPSTGGHTLSLEVHTGPAGTPNGFVDIEPVFGVFGGDQFFKGFYDVSSHFDLAGAFTIDGVGPVSVPFTIDEQAIPEPMSLALFGIGCAGILITRRRPAPVTPNLR